MSNTKVQYLSFVLRALALGEGWVWIVGSGWVWIVGLLGGGLVWISVDCQLVWVWIGYELLNHCGFELAMGCWIGVGLKQCGLLNQCGKIKPRMVGVL